MSEDETEPIEVVTMNAHRDPLKDLIELKDEIETISSHKNAREALRESEEDEVTVETVINQMPNTLLSFFALATATIEERCTQLILENVIADSVSENEDVQDLFRGEKKNPLLNQHRREKLLHQTEVIDGILKSDMSEVRGVRNDLVHSPHERLTQESEINDQIELTLNVICRLNNTVIEDYTDPRVD
jgi:hypothetical protein